MAESTPLPVKLEPPATPISSIPPAQLLLQAPPTPVSPDQPTNLAPNIKPLASNALQPGSRPYAPTPAQVISLSLQSPLTDVKLVSKWRGSAFDPEYTDCVIRVQGKAIGVHRAMVLPQSDYLKSLCSKIPDPITGLFTINIPDAACPIPSSSLFLVVQGVLCTMYLHQATSILRPSNPLAAGFFKPTFLAQALVLAGLWKADFAADVMLNELATTWSKLKVASDPVAKIRLCAGIKAVLEVLEGSHNTPTIIKAVGTLNTNAVDQLSTQTIAFAPSAATTTSSTPDTSAIIRRIGHDLCVEFIMSHMTDLQSTGHLLPLTQQFSTLMNAILSIQTRPRGGHNAKKYKCSRCVELNRRTQAAAHVADPEKSPCTICRALDGELDVKGKPSPVPRTPTVPRPPPVPRTPAVARPRIRFEGPHARADEDMDCGGVAVAARVPKRSAVGDAKKVAAKKKKTSKGGRGADDPDADYVPRPSEVIDLVSD